MIYTCQSRRGVKLRRCVPTIGIGVLLADRGNAMEAGPLNAVELGMDWAMILRKIVSFELMSSTTETALPLAFYGGTTATVGNVLVVITTGSMCVYLAREPAREGYPGAIADRAAPEAPSELDRWPFKAEGRLDVAGVGTYRSDPALTSSQFG